MLSYTTHRLWLLAVGLFSLLLIAYLKQLSNLIYKNLSIVFITKRFFYLLFRNIYQAPFTKKNILHVFEKPSIFLVDLVTGWQYYAQARTTLYYKEEILGKVLGLRRLSPPCGAGWELEALLPELRRVHPSSDYKYSCVRNATSAVTVRLFKPSTRPQQRKVLALGITLSPGYASTGG